MHELGFESCKADPDVWIRPSTKADGTDYYQYVLLYTDDILPIMEEPQSFIVNELSSCFVMKDKSIGKLTQYLGNKVTKVDLENGRKSCSFSSSQYVQSQVDNVKAKLKKEGGTLPTRNGTPWCSDYQPEPDVSPELSLEKASYNQSLIGVLRWICELGRADITMEVSVMASMMVMPREGHLEQVFHIFAYLEQNHNSKMVLTQLIPSLINPSSTGKIGRHMNSD